MQTIDTTDFQIVLQKLGFTHWKMPLEWLVEDSEVETWKKTVLTNKGLREVNIQLWSDGRHRVSHILNDRESTPPTYFNSPWVMIEAIVTEVTRMDHRPR